MDDMRSKLNNFKEDLGNNQQKRNDEEIVISVEDWEIYALGFITSIDDLTLNFKPLRVIGSEDTKFEKIEVSLRNIYDDLNSSVEHPWGTFKDISSLYVLKREGNKYHFTEFNSYYAGILDLDIKIVYSVFSLE